MGNALVRFGFLFYRKGSEAKTQRALIDVKGVSNVAGLVWSRRIKPIFWYPRQGSNLRPFAPEANALIH